MFPNLGPGELPSHSTGGSVPAPAPMQRGQDVVERLRIRMHRARVRPVEYFKDYDKLHCGQVTDNQFIRGLTLALSGSGASVDLTPMDMQSCIDRYGSGDNKVNYRAFCKDIGGAFVMPCEGGADADLESNPLAQVPEVFRTQLISEVATLSADEEDQVAAQLAALKTEVNAKRVDIYPIFLQMDRKFGFSGGVTKDQFMRALHFAGLAVPDDGTLLIRKFRNPNNGFYINYMPFVSAIDSATRLERGDQLYFTDESPFQPALEPAVAAAGDLEAGLNAAKLVVLQKRLRTRSFFEDHDGLRSGSMAVATFRKALNLMLPDAAPGAISAFVAHYALGPGQIGWWGFCDDLDTVFTLQHLEEAPLASVAGVELTAFSLMSKTARMAVVDDLDPQLAAAARGVITKIRRMRKSSDFAWMARDFDRSNRGRVSAAQFSAVLSNGRLALSEAESQTLVDYLSDGGGVNYRAFFDALKTDAPLSMDGAAALTAVGPADGDEAFDTAAILLEIQGAVVQHGRRIVDFCKDYDRLNCGRITDAQFARSMDVAAIGLTAAKAAALAEAYKADGGYVDYLRLSADVEAATAAPNLERDPLAATAPLAALNALEAAAAQRRVANTDSKVAEASLDRASEYYRTRRPELMSGFQDYDRVKIGSVSKTQFDRVLQANGLALSRGELDSIAGKFSVNIGGRTDVHYRTFLTSVKERADALQVLAAAM